VVRQHVTDCEQWQALYAADPSRALDPEAEFTRWQADDADDERFARRAAAVEETDQRRAAGRERWATPEDILA
jgi:hypothetical protein